MKPPLFWNNRPSAPGLWSNLLMPLAKLWQFGVKYRLENGKNHTLSVPVICIGNVNLGGTGKTPTVINIVARLVKMGLHPHILSRGYGGSLIGPVKVDPLQHSADDVGDEPLLLSAFTSTWVAKHREKAACAAVADGADVLVLDDGLQNPVLVKDLTVMVVDAKAGFGNGRIFPAGPLRESVKSGLERSQLVVSIGSSDNHRDLVKTWPDLTMRPVIQAQLEPLQTGMDWHDMRVLAFAGIGRPEKFYASLRSVGANIIQTRSYADHQKFPTRILQRLVQEARNNDAQLVTTEKDAVRLPPEFRQQALTFPVRLQIGDPTPLDRALQSLFD